MTFSFVKINDNFEISEGATYKLLDELNCEITSKGLLKALKKGSFAYALAKGSMTSAEVEGAHAYASGRESEAYAMVDGAVAFAYGKGTKAYAWAKLAQILALRGKGARSYYLVETEDPW